MRISRRTLPLKIQNKSLIETKIFRPRKNFITLNTEKSFTTNESYSLSTEKNNQTKTNKISKNISNLNSLRNLNYTIKINNDFNNYKFELPKIKMQTLSQADNYIEQKRRFQQGFIPTHLTTRVALQKSREINLKNFIIKKMNEKRQEIENNEKNILEQIKDREKAYENEYKNFVEVQRNNKIKEKMENDEYNIIKLNTLETEKILNQEKKENKRIEDHIKKEITSLLSCKVYASFIYKLFDKKFIYDEIKNFDGKNYYKIMKKFIDIYEKNQQDKFSLKEEDDFLKNLNEETFFNQIEIKEDNLIKQLEHRKMVDDEIINLNIKSKEEIGRLEDIKKDKEEIKIFFNDNKNQQTQILKNIKEYDAEEIKSYLNYILELNKSIHSIKQKSNNIDIELEKDQPLSIYCNDTLNALEQKEILVNKYINEIANIYKYGSNDDIILIEKIINERKRFNKKIKKEEILKLQQEIQIRKYLKLNDANKVVIKGRKVIEDFPLIENRKKMKKLPVKENDTDFDYFFYL